LFLSDIKSSKNLLLLPEGCRDDALGLLLLLLLCSHFDEDNKDHGVPPNSPELEEIRDSI